MHLRSPYWIMKKSNCDRFQYYRPFTKKVHCYSSWKTRDLCLQFIWSQYVHLHIQLFNKKCIMWTEVLSIKLSSVSVFKDQWRPWKYYNIVAGQRPGQWPIRIASNLHGEGWTFCNTEHRVQRTTAKDDSFDNARSVCDNLYAISLL